uniref:Uncharacterized protein n=1 Tax=Aegilops tauschii subsp. strangulata TaxID=200361 RepID=A0A453LAM8_AEGTS
MQAPGDNTYLQMPICIIKGEISARSQISNDMENLEYGLILTISKTLILQLEPGDAHPVPVSSSWSCAAVTRSDGPTDRDERISNFQPVLGSRGRGGERQDSRSRASEQRGHSTRSVSRSGAASAA